MLVTKGSSPTSCVVLPSLSWDFQPAHRLIAAVLDGDDRIFRLETDVILDQSSAGAADLSISEDVATLVLSKNSELATSSPMAIWSPTL